MNRRTLAIIISLVLCFSACSAETGEAPESVTVENNYSVTESVSSESFPSQETERTDSSELMTLTEELTAEVEHEIYYLPFTASDAGLESDPHRLEGYAHFLGDYFVDEGQWNAYIVYPLSQMKGKEDLPDPGPEGLAQWMEELKLEVIYDYPYSYLYYAVRGDIDYNKSLDVYGYCAVAAPESRMEELFGRENDPIHGWYFRVLPAMDPSLPYMTMYDPHQTYYYHGIAIEPTE